MRVLGISPLDTDATVSCLEDGEILFACAEERLSRVKQQDGFPQRALELALARTGWTPESIDAVAYAFFDGRTEARLIRDALRQDARDHALGCTAESLRHLQAAASNGYAVDRSLQIPGFEDEADEFMPAKPWLKRRAYGESARRPWLDWGVHRHYFRKWATHAGRDHARRTEELNRGLAAYGLEQKLRRFRHHDAHAANALYGSGFEDALLVSFDAYGSGCCGGIYTGGKDGIRLVHQFRFPHSLGIFFENVTSALGFRPCRHEGKIVGLAAYGNPDHLYAALRSRFDCRDGDLRIHGGLNYLLARAMADRFAKRDVAAAHQRVLEDVVCETVAYWVRRTGLRQVAVSGGVHANVKLNQRIREIPGVEALFVYPNMGDGGLATGAAALCFAPRVFDRPALQEVYFGPDYSDAEIAAALRAASLPVERAGDIAEEIAQRLATNHIVAHFDGRMEYGPRALGNRSILYPASDPAVNQWLNHQLGRTEFMPFAPVALADEADKLFRGLAGCEKTAEFMTVTFDCTNRMKRDCPAAVHVDGTARPQLVSEQTNPRLYRILQAYQRRTGIGAIINTSFNMHEEPIVCSPADAVRAFLLGNIDYLAIGSYLVAHPKLRDNPPRSREERQPALQNV